MVECILKITLILTSTWWNPPKNIMQSLYKGGHFQTTWADLREACSSGYLKKIDLDLALQLEKPKNPKSL